MGGRVSEGYVGGRVKVRKGENVRVNECMIARKKRKGGRETEDEVAQEVGGGGE